jgi:hypothetical protein
MESMDCLAMRLLSHKWFYFYLTHNNFVWICLKNITIPQIQLHIDIKVIEFKKKCRIYWKPHITQQSVQKTKHQLKTNTSWNTISHTRKSFIIFLWATDWINYNTEVSQEIVIKYKIIFSAKAYALI